MSTKNTVRVVELAYSIELGESEWLRALAEAVEPDFAAGLGTCVYVYDASSIPVRMLDFADRGTPFSAADCAAAIAMADAHYVDETWRSVPFAAASETPGYDELPIVTQFFRPLGVHDFVAVNGADPSGLGVWIGAPLPRRYMPASADRRTWTRVALHLAAAFRLRKTDAPRLDAVLTPGGRIEHAEGDAKLADARAALREAVKRIERARTMSGRRDPERAVEGWNVLVDARWSLVDRFESGGQRYVVALENASRAPGPEVLTPRERQVVAAATLGRANKIIAYDLGLSASTVRVLLTRAARRLEVTTRRELVALYRAHMRARGELVS